MDSIFTSKRSVANFNASDGGGMKRYRTNKPANSSLSICIGSSGGNNRNAGGLRIALPTDEGIHNIVKMIPDEEFTNEQQ